VGADFEVIRKPEGETIQNIIHTRSAAADVVFLGMREINPDEAEGQVDRLLDLMSGLQTVLLVRNSGPFQGQLLGVEPTSSPLS
jgi:hypothetical protein